MASLVAHGLCIDACESMHSAMSCAPYEGQTFRHEVTAHVGTAHRHGLWLCKRPLSTEQHVVVTCTPLVPPSTCNFGQHAPAAGAAPGCRASELRRLRRAAVCRLPTPCHHPQPRRRHAEWHHATLLHPWVGCATGRPDAQSWWARAVQNGFPGGPRAVHRCM